MSNSVDPDNADILARSGFRLLTKFSRQIVNVVGKNENHNMISFCIQEEFNNPPQYSFKDWLHKLFTYECRLLIAFANSLNSDQALQNAEHDLDPNCLTL